MYTFDKFKEPLVITPQDIVANVLYIVPFTTYPDFLNNSSCLDILHITYYEFKIQN